MPTLTDTFNPTPIHDIPDFAAFAAANPWVGAPIGAIQTLPNVGFEQQYANCTAYGPFGGTPFEVHGAIRDKYNQVGGPSGILGLPTTNETGTPDGLGRYNHFERGSIYYHPGLGAFEVHGAIHALWASLGWERFGYPITDETAGPGTGRYNHFQIFLPDGSTPQSGIYWSPATGAHEIHGAIYADWQAKGAQAAYLGYPITDEYGLPGGAQSDFENGSIYWSGPTGTVFMPQYFLVDIPLTFGTGIAVGGHARLEIFSDGTTHYTGHFHDSGFPSYDILCTLAVKDSTGRAYAASEGGHTNGTDSSGSRDHDWDNWGQEQDIQDNWALIRNGGTGGGTASVTSDWSAQKIAEDLLAVFSAIVGILSLPFLSGSSKPSTNTTYELPTADVTGGYQIPQTGTVAQPVGPPTVGEGLSQ